jgi:hypothetical protein
MNLIEGLQSEINRAREIIDVYKSLPKNAGWFASAMIEASIKQAEKAIANDDTIAMIKCLKDLEQYEY